MNDNLHCTAITIRSTTGAEHIAIMKSAFTLHNRLSILGGHPTAP